MVPFASAGDRVRYARIDQRLRTDDDAGAPGAVDHDQPLGVRREVADAMNQLRPRHVDPARNAHAPVLADRPAVEHDELAALGAQPGQFLGRKMRGAVGRLDELAERLARDMHALEQRKAGGPPAGDAALQHRNVAVAEAVEPTGGSLREAITVVAEHDRHSAPGHEPGQVDLQTA
jgi:hypothetical protein